MKPVNDPLPLNDESNTDLALVTGAASGIGLATTRRFLQEGIRVIALDYSQEGLDRMADAANDARLIPCQADLSDTGALPALVKQLCANHGPISILVNNAGAWHYEPLTGIPDERWEHIFRINVTAPFVLMREITPAMIAQRRGVIINISSRNAMVGSKGSCAYDASKAALTALTRTASGELAPHGIRVNAICPGVIATPANQDLLDDEEASSNYLRLIPMNRYGEPEEIAGICYFLTTPDAGFITGQTIVADGGQMAYTDWKRLFEKA